MISKNLRKYLFNKEMFIKHISHRSMSVQGKSVTYDNVSKISFIYPRYESPFIVSINPNYSQWMDRYCTQWAVDNCGPMAQCIQLRNKIERSDCGLFAAVTYPTANWHRCQTLMKWSIIFFICDDYHDLTSESNGGQLSVKPFWHQIYEVLDGLVEGQYHNSSEWPLFVRAVQQILREIYFDFSENQIKRSVKMIRDYIKGNVKENQWTDRRQPLPDWDTYWSARMGSVGGQMALQLIEYAKRIELTDSQWNHNLIEDLNQLVSQQILLVNDYYTFRKELNENDNKFEEMKHSFPILVQRHGLSLQQSVNKINEMIKTKDNQIVDQIKRIESCEQLKSSDVLEYVNGVQQFLGGYWRHAVTARRYHGLNFTGVVPPEGYFLYDDNQTIIKPIDNKMVDFGWNKVVPQNVQPITY